MIAVMITKLELGGAQQVALAVAREVARTRARLVFVTGSVIAMWPDAREQRRLAERFAGEGDALARA